jgi:hypothetical protein
MLRRDNLYHSLRSEFVATWERLIRLTDGSITSFCICGADGRSEDILLSEIADEKSRLKVLHRELAPYVR